MHTVILATHKVPDILNSYVSFKNTLRLLCSTINILHVEHRWTYHVQPLLAVQQSKTLIFCIYSLSKDINSRATTSNDIGASVEMPSVGLSGLDVKDDLQADLKLPDGHSTLPQKKLPKFTMPSFHLPSFKKPKGEFDASADLDMPNASANLTTPDINLPKIDHKEPDLDINGPSFHLNSPKVNADPNLNIDIDEPSSKFKWPHLKWKHPKGKVPAVSADVPAIDTELSMPNIDGSIDAPGVDVSLPQADVKVPTVEAKVPNHDSKFGKFNWPHLKWKKIGGDLDANLESPTIGVDGDINAPDIDLDLPKVEAEGPNVDMPTFNADIDGPSGKINWPHLRWKKKKGPKADFDIDASPNMPDLNLQVDEPSLPKVDADLPTVNADLDAPSGKFSWPHLKLKKPVLHAPKSNVDLNADMDINADISKPEGLKLSAPEAGLDIEPPSAKVKWPTFKKTKRSIPDADLDVNGVSVSPPNIDGGINLADGNINLPKADLNVNAPDVEAPSGKFNFFKKPLFGTLKGPKVDLNDADLGKPELALDLPNVSGPKLDGSIDAPELNIASPKADVDADVGSGIKLPKFKLPSFKGLKYKTPEVDNIKAPQIDASVKALDVDVSSKAEQELSMSLPKFGNIGDAPDIKVSHSGLSAPTIKGNLDGSGPQLDLSDHLPKLSLPSSAIEGPNATGGIDLPKANVESPKLEVNAPDVDAPSGIFKLFKKPIFGTLTTPKVELDDADIEKPALALDLPEVSAPQVDGTIDAPGLNITPPKTNVDADLGSKIRIPKLKIKGLNLKTPEVETIKAPEIDASSSSEQDLSLSLPKIGTQNVEVSHSGLSAPTITGNLDSPDTKLDLNLRDHLPKLNLQSPKIEVPVVKPDLPSIDVKEKELELPKAEIKVPDIDLKTESGLNMSVPKTGKILSIPGTKVLTDAPEAPGVELKASDMDINLTDFKVSDLAPTADVNFDSNLGDFKSPQNLPQFSKLKPEAPRFDPSIGTEINGPKISVDNNPLKDVISLPESDLTLPKVVDQEKGSKIDIKPPQIEVSPQKPTLQHFNLPSINFSPTNIEAAGLDINPSSKIVPDVKVKSPGVEEAISPPSASIESNLSPAELDLSTKTEVQVKDSPKSKIRLPFKWGFRSNSRAEEDGGGDSETDGPDDGDDIPQFKFHSLPKADFDGLNKNGDIFNLSKPDLGVKDYVMSKGVVLPIVNATTKTTEKVSVAERLKMAKEKVPGGASPTEATTNLPLARGDTFKVDKAGTAPDSDERDKLSLSLSNMLGLNTDDSNTD